MTRKAVVTFLAAVALGVGVFVSSSAMADKSGRCDKTTACNDEISDACGPNPSMSCAKNITDQCKAFLCTCTGEPGLLACGAIQCCVQSSPMGPFDTCIVETSAQCAAQGGIGQGSGTCSPNPCLIQCCVQTASTTTSTTTSTTSTSTTPGTAPTTTSASTTTSTTTTTTASSPMGAFNFCVVETPQQCAAQGGISQGSGTCSPNPCLPACFQPGPNCVGCGTCGRGLCASALSNTCSVHHNPDVCIDFPGCQTSPCLFSGDAGCAPGQACVIIQGLNHCCPACP